MKVVLLRHGEAESLRTSDAERALTERGVAQARLAGSWLAQQLGSTAVPLRLLASPYRRAQETAAVLNLFLRQPIHTLEEIIPDADPCKALEAIGEHGRGGDWVIVVSHMPLLASLASWMEEAVIGAQPGFMLAEARIFEADLLEPGMAALRGRFIPALSA